MASTLCIHGLNQNRPNNKLIIHTCKHQIPCLHCHYQIQNQTTKPAIKTLTAHSETHSTTTKLTARASPSPHLTMASLFHSNTQTTTSRLNLHLFPSSNQNPTPINLNQHTHGLHHNHPSARAQTPPTPSTHAPPLSHRLTTSTPFSQAAADLLRRKAQATKPNLNLSIAVADAGSP